MDKKEIRKEIIKKRDTIKIEEKIEKDKAIRGLLKELDLYKNSINIFIYVGFGSEIDTSIFIDDFIKDNKRIFIPKTNISKKEMNAVEITDLNALEKNKYGILEPKDDNQIINKNDIDLVILPGVAFDISGSRIGYGGGYYDKYLMDIKDSIPKVALAYDFQLLEDIPVEEHDIKADYIITEMRQINLLK